MSGERIIRRLITCAIVAIASVVCRAASAGTITVDEWSVGVMVDWVDDRVVDASSTVSNPLNALFTAIAPPSFSASATHAFSWSDSAASFRIDTELEVPDLPTAAQSGWSACYGQMFFTAEEDLLLSMDAAFNYDFPPHRFAAYLFVNVREWNPTSSLLRVSKFAISSDYVQTSGTLAASAEDLLLTRGKQYMVDYSLRLTASGDETNAVATGNTHLQFTMLPVPEPTTALFLIAAGIPAIARRRRDPRSSS